MSDVNVHIDTALEWKCLAHFTDPKFYQWIDKVTPALFTGDRVTVYEAIRQAHSVYGDVTPEGIEFYLGKSSPTQLDVSVGTNIESIIDRLSNIALRRQIHEKGRKFISLADAQTLALDVVQSELEFTPIMREEDAELLPGSQILLANYRRKKEGTYNYVSTGLPALDSFMRGEWPVGFTLLGALSGTGKTSLALQSMLEMAKLDIPSMMINLEMEKEALIERMAASVARVDSNDIAIANLTDEEEARFEQAVNYVNSLPVKMICNSDLDVGRIIAHIKEWANKGYKVFFIDHLQLIGYSGESRDIAYGDIAWALKIIANKLKIRIILLTQLTKKDGGYEVNYSGQVRPKAETFLILSSESDADRRTVTVAFEKNRNGKLGNFPLIFEAKYQYFEDRYLQQSIAAD